MPRRSMPWRPCALGCSAAWLCARRAASACCGPATPCPASSAMSRRWTGYTCASSCPASSRRWRCRCWPGCCCRTVGWRLLSSWPYSSSPGWCCHWLLQRRPSAPVNGLPQPGPGCGLRRWTRWTDSARSAPMAPRAGCWPLCRLVRPRCSRRNAPLRAWRRWRRPEPPPAVLRRCSQCWCSHRRDRRLP